MHTGLSVYAIVSLVASQLVMVIGSAVAQTSLPCADQTSGVLTSCLAKQYAATDRQLAEAYKASLARAEASGLGRNLIMDWKRALQETQRKWIAYREADCGPPIAYETAKRPDQRQIEQLRCKITHTQQRLLRHAKTE